MLKFKNKYRTTSIRLQSWDYSCNGVYFITICSKDKIPCFGQIINGSMQLSHIGVLADVFWHEIRHHTQNIELDKFVVMPNHIHGILIINKPVETLHATSLPDEEQADLNGKNKTMSAISPKENSISTVIRSYKSAVSKHSRRLGYEFEWQSRFYDHIIRNEESLNNIQQYVINNPKSWETDKFYTLY